MSCPWHLPRSLLSFCRRTTSNCLRLGIERWETSPECLLINCPNLVVAQKLHCCTRVRQYLSCTFRGATAAKTASHGNSEKVSAVELQTAGKNDKGQEVK
ncbi:unnamed protein product [Polarella glacialis]|uniref:Uncharacterized protein n=1 Tax=Polarella glacialis TaxID=89957 RepID=A0A813FNJ9_POLGL|nr:unnamed protein product [Polarella glacialis]